MRSCGSHVTYLGVSQVAGALVLAQRVAFADQMRLFRSSENRDAHFRRAPSRLVPAGLPARRHLPGHPSPTRFACRKTQCGGVVGVWVAVSTHRVTSFSPSRSA